MRLTVADLDSNELPHSFRAAQLAGLEDNTASLLYVPLPTSLRIRGLDDVIAGLPPWALRNRMTVLGVHPQTAPLLDEDALDDIARRVPGTPLYLLTHGAKSGAVELRSVRGPSIEGLDQARVIEEIRAADMQSILESPGALLPGTDRFHYAGPNDHHYGSFLRPGFALTTNNKLDRVSFWLLPHVRGRRNIVVDHWSMIAIAHHAYTYASRFLSAKTEDPLIEALRGYEAIDTLAPRLRRAFPQPSSAQALLLLSINSSGSMAHDVVLPSLEQAVQSNATVVALASASGDDDREVEALVRLDESFRRQSADSCSLCDLGRTVLPIDKSTYLLKLAAYTETTAIRALDAKATREVIEAYAGIGAFGLHRSHTEAGDERHHGFYIDVLPMIKTQRFQDALRECLACMSGVNPTVVVCPPSEAAATLAEEVAQILGVGKVLMSEEQGLRSLGEDAVRVLCKASDILLVDDVVITGRRIEGFRQELISLRRSLGVSGDFTMGCLVGVARARDEKALQGCRDFVHHRREINETFAAVETLHLPNWDERDCPWCRELRVLVKLPAELADLPDVEERMQQLGRTDGLSTPFFTVGTMARAEAAPPSDADAWLAQSQESPLTDAYGDRFWELNPGSVFGDLQGVDLVVSVAAAVHGLRAKGVGAPGSVEPRLDRRFRPPISKVLDPNLYLFGRFYEPVLLASILRACNEWDIRSPDIDADLASAMDQQLSYLSSGEYLLGEAIILAKLGHLPRDSVKALATSRGGDLAIVANTIL